jgi:hypothetical protein
MSHSLIDTIFNCINFAARVGIVIYLIKKYVTPKITSSIIYEKESIKILERQHDELRSQSNEVDKHIKDQEQLYFDLQSKFELWQASLVQEQQEYDRTCKDYEQKLAYQFEKKQQYAHRKMLIEQEFPVLFEKIEKDLQEKIKKDPQLGKKYIKDLLDFTEGKVV